MTGPEVSAHLMTGFCYLVLFVAATWLIYELKRYRNAPDKDAPKNKGGAGPGTGTV